MKLRIANAKVLNFQGKPGKFHQVGSHRVQNIEKIQNAGTFGKQVSSSQEQQDYNHCGCQKMKHLVQGVFIGSLVSSGN